MAILTVLSAVLVGIAATVLIEYFVGKTYVKRKPTSVDLRIGGISAATYTSDTPINLTPKPGFSVRCTKGTNYDIFPSGEAK